MRRQICVAGVMLFQAALVAQGGVQSAAPARELVQQLDARRLDAIAAADPQMPGRFIAALYVAPSQLLVVGGAHPSRDAMTSKIAQQQYRDVYLDLQTTPGIEGKWFVHDLGADGLSRDASTSVDNVYQSGARLVLLDGGSVKRDPFQRSDAEYARMLQALLGALQVAAPPAGAQLTTK